MDRKDSDLLNILNTVAAIMNFAVAVIVTFEAITRFVSFLKEWKPVKRRHMGFYRKK